MKMKYLSVLAVSLLTGILSCLLIAPAIPALREPEAGDVAMTLVALGVLLGLSASRVAWIRIQHLKRAT